MEQQSNSATPSETVTPTCGYHCVYFYGTNQSCDEGAPPAWCRPPGSSMARPCLPGENACNKSCFKAANF